MKIAPSYSSSIFDQWLYFTGLADPAALVQAVAAYQACHFIGMPECEVTSS